MKIGNMKIEKVHESKTTSVRSGGILLMLNNY